MLVSRNLTREEPPAAHDSRSALPWHGALASRSNQGWLRAIRLPPVVASSIFAVKPKSDPMEPIFTAEPIAVTELNKTGKDVNSETSASDEGSSEVGSSDDGRSNEVKSDG
eukprot:5894394-Prymnesium_polylepis.1